MDADLLRFTKQLEGFQEAFTRASTNVLREVVVDLGSTVITLSPVLTGLFRGNWQLTVGTPSSHSLIETDPEGNETIARIKARVATLVPGELAILANNLEYGYNVETIGWKATPAYAPVRLTEVQFISMVDKAAAKYRVTNNE